MLLEEGVDDHNKDRKALTINLNPNYRLFNARVNFIKLYQIKTSLIITSLRIC